MTKYVTNRIIQNVFTFFLFITIVFLLMDAAPGDYANIFLGDPRLTPQMRDTLRRSMGLDQPVWNRYITWLSNLIKGDMGISFSNYPRPVIDVIRERAPRTIFLFLNATIFSYYLGFISGKILAWKRGTALEYAATVAGVIMYTIFVPWFALMMLLIFGYSLKLFPLGKFIDPILWRKAPVDANFVFNNLLLTFLLILIFMLIIYLVSNRFDDQKKKRQLFDFGVLVVISAVVGFWAISGNIKYALNIIHHVILPILTLGLVNFAGTMLLTRNSMLETIREDYIITARAKGLPENQIRDKHAARNALLPVVTAFILSISFVMDGGVITESIFSWPGMGLTLLKAAAVEDIPMVVGALLFTGTIALTGHLFADILYAFLDPRVRYS